METTRTYESVLYYQHYVTTVEVEVIYLKHVFDDIHYIFMFPEGRA